jgi:hypothetical protein
MLSSKQGRRVLSSAADEMYCSENMNFLNLFYELKEDASLDLARQILDTFFSEGTDQPLNVESRTKLAMEALAARVNRGLVSDDDCSCELFMLPFQEVRYQQQCYVIFLCNYLWFYFQSNGVTVCVAASENAKVCCACASRMFFKESRVTE